MSDSEPDWRDLDAERHAPSGWWGEPRASESRATVEREAQRAEWRKAEVRLAADQRRQRGRPRRNAIGRRPALGYRVRPPADDDDQASG